MKSLTSPVGLLLIFSAMGCSPWPQRIPTHGAVPEDLERVTWQGRPALINGVGHLSAGSPKGELELHFPGQDGRGQVIHRGDARKPYHPAGMCWVESSRAPGLRRKKLLYTTSQLSRDVATVEIFEFTTTGVESLGNVGPIPRVKVINGLAAFADGSVYVTVMNLIPDGKAHITTVPGELPETGKNRILAFRPGGPSGLHGSWKTVAAGLNGANGLAAAPDGRMLFACAYHSRRILCFPRDPDTNALQSPVGDGLSLPFCPDNLKRDPQRNIYEIGGQRTPLLTGINLYTGLPCARGGAAAFIWDGKRPVPTADTPDRDRAAASDPWGPSTAIRVGDFLFLSHIRNAALTRIPLPARK